jgi:hypothetical protein
VSSLRTQGPIRRVACVQECCWKTFAQHNVLWLWVPAFAGTTMTTHLRILATQSARGLLASVAPEIRGRRECRAPGAPAAACAKVESKKAHALVRSHREHPAFPAQWFTAYFALSLVIGLFCHHRLADTSARLDASVEASGPHDFAVHFRRPRQKRPPRPPHPASRS